MTGVLPFLFFSQAHNHHNQGRTTIMSQSFTSMDARTQTTKYRMDEFGLYELIEYDGIMIKQYLPEDKDTPVYPEPEGDPSY